MSLRIITADERLAEARGKTTVALFGPSGVGKTSLLRTLPPDETLCIDLEAGMKSVQDWPGMSIPVRTFADALDIACLVGGVDPAADPNSFFSEGHYGHVVQGLCRAGAGGCRQAHRLRRFDHRSHPPGHGLGQDPARIDLRQDRQARSPRRLWSARPRGYRPLEAPAARAGPDRESSSASSSASPTSSTASTGARRWRAARPPASCPASSTR